MPAIQEALLLCLCYIDACGNFYYESESTRQNFIKILITFSNNPQFSAIHPRQLIRYLEKNGKKYKKTQDIFEKIKLFLEGLPQQKKLFDQEEFKALLQEKNLLVHTESERLVSLLKNGSIAAIAYENLRCPAVHNLGASNISFDTIIYYDEPVKTLSFPVLLEALKNIISKIREIIEK